MQNSCVLNMPVEQSLEFVSTVRLNRVDSEGKLLDDIVYEIYRILLIMSAVDP